MPNGTWTAWWRGVEHPPPTAWKYTFEEFTNDETADEWALAAAIFIAQYRRRRSQGPTFRELFEHLLPDTDGAPSSLPQEWDAMERRRRRNDFRRHVAIEWRRRGYIGFEPRVTRSLRVGPRFRERSRARNAPAYADGAPDQADPARTRITTEISLTADAARILLRIPRNSLRRLSRRGHLHAVTWDEEWRFPSWQFAGRPQFAVLPGISIIAPAIPQHWPPTMIHAFMMTPHCTLAAHDGTHSPIDWLIRGRDPRQVVSILETVKSTHE